MLFTSAVGRASPLGEGQPAPRCDSATTSGLTGTTAQSSSHASPSPGPLEVLIAIVWVVIATPVVVIIVSIVIVIVFVAVIIMGVRVTPSTHSASAPCGWWHMRRPIVIVFIIPERK